MSRDDEAAATREAEIQAILERGRRTRRPLPRLLWLAAVLVAVICATGLAIVLLDDPAPGRGAGARPPSSSGAGFGSGLAIGAAAGLAIGFALARAQRRDHSSRSRP